MRKNCLYLIALFTAVSTVAAPSYAQTLSAETNPMAYARALHTAKLPSAAGLKKSNLTDSADYFTYNYGASKTISAQIAAELTATYGPPKTGRGDLKVWEIKNAQQRDVTIMIGSNSAGQQEFIIDQRSPARNTHRPQSLSTRSLVTPSRQNPSRATSPTRLLPQERD